MNKEDLFALNYSINIQKNKKSDIEDYIHFLNERCEKEMKLIKKEKCKNDKDSEDEIPKYSDFSLVVNKNYNMQKLKTFMKAYKLKVSGNKTDLLTRLYSYLKLSFNILKIQKLYRGHIQRKYNNCHGPAFKKREICTNTDDFLTMESLNEMTFTQFISYKDEDGFVYGFDIISLYNLIIKTEGVPKNPYNRNDIPLEVTENIKKLIRLSKLLKYEINIEIKDIEMEISNEKSLELKILGLFQSINSLGNYSEPSWFLSLNRSQLIRYVRELYDIWNYRAQIPNNIKRNVCPPHGNPFQNVNINYIPQDSSIQSVQKVVLSLLEKFVNTGIDRDSKYLGASYVLGALTIINENAALTLPWLYHSFSYF